MYYNYEETVFQILFILILNILQQKNGAVILLTNCDLVTPVVMILNLSMKNAFLKSHNRNSKHFCSITVALYKKELQLKT